MDVKLSNAIVSLTLVCFGIAGCGDGAIDGGGGGGSFDAGAPSDAEIPPEPDPTGLPGSYGYESYPFAVPDDDAECTGATNDSAQIQRVYFAQNHLMEPGWPLWLLLGDRPALVKVDVTGAGSAPDVVVIATADGEQIGRLCLTGPASLPADVPANDHRRDNSFTATLPASWIRPGLAVRVQAGIATRDYTAEQLAVGAAPEINLAMLVMDVLNYNDGKPDVLPDADFLPNLASALPAARVRLGTFPERIALPQLVVGGNRSDGRPEVMDKRLCRNSDPDPSTCQTLEGVGEGDLNAAALRTVAAILRATGDYPFTFYYGNTGHLFPGGWGGNKSFVSADFAGVTLHEMGHSLSLPHWGQGWYKPDDPEAAGFSYPYGGLKDDGGGRGDTWVFDHDTGAFVSPVCEDEGQTEVFGQERSDAMFRSSWCIQYRDGEPGPWDGFSDFSALAMYRWLVGAPDSVSSQVPYSRTGMAEFYLPRTTGFPTLRVDGDGNRSLVRDAPTGDLPSWEQLPFYVPQQWDAPVYLVYGVYHPEFAEANVIYEPLAYFGGLPAVVDPTDPATFASLQQGNSGPYGDHFWWPKDVTLRFVFDDGTDLHALYPYEGVDRDWQPGSGPWRWDLMYWAIAIPRDASLERIEVYRRPFLVRFPDFTDEGNIANPSLGITAENFMDDAVLMGSIDL